MTKILVTIIQSLVLMTFSLLLSNAALATPEDYPKTTEALQARYADEVIAHQKYGAYAEHALKEDYPGIAHLFRALAAAEAIHARNFARLLKKLGHEPVRPRLTFTTDTTRKHLQQAATVEADEIDKEYPAILEGIQAENHQEAIKFITYAWQSEQQHRDLILKIKKGASWFFGMLVNKIEGKPTRYYICQICGSTVTDLPAEQCPICDHPPSDYKEVPGFEQSRVKPMTEQKEFWE